MNDLTGQPGELKATITITRKATGKVETYELTGTVQPESYQMMPGAGDGNKLVWPISKGE